MDIKKFLLIARKDLTIAYRDYATLTLMYLAPLLITFIIAAAFSGLTGGGDTGINDIPVAVVNLDKGGGFANFGQQLADTFLNPPDGLANLVEARAFTSVDEARQSVREGKSAAAIIIPEDFSARLNTADPRFGQQKITLEVMRDPGSPISGEIVSGIVRQIVNGFTSSSIAVAAAIQANPLLLTQIGQIAPEVGQQAFTNPPLTVSATEQAQAAGPGFNLLAFFAPAMAIFFMNYSAAFGAIDIITEREKGTLQRMIVTPTARMTILGGKLVATFVNCVIQLVLLIVATTLLAPLLGNTQPVWSSNYPALALIIFVTVGASVGLGAIVAALSKNAQQASILASAILTLMGIVGGTFFPAGTGPALGPISYLTMNHWATTGFFTLNQTNSLPLLNVAVLLVMFVVFFGTGVFIFRRRLDI